MCRNPERGMSKTTTTKKKWIREDLQETSVPSALAQASHRRPVMRKKSRRAETRLCPVCREEIPLRLLSVHTQLESARLEDLIKQIGVVDPYTICDVPSRSRASSIRARKSLAIQNADAAFEKCLQIIKRNRKRRHASLKEITLDGDEVAKRKNAWTRGIEAGLILCPVCSVTVRGDQNLLDAHVDSCLENEVRRLEEARISEEEQRRAQEAVWEEGENPDGHGGHVGNVRGTGFYTRNGMDEDVDDEIDIDGDDRSVYGEAQFTEGDILSVNDDQPHDEDNESDVESGGQEEQMPPPSLRDLVAGGRVIGSQSEGVVAVEAKMNEVMGMEDAGKTVLAMRVAREKRDKSALVAAQEKKVQQHLETNRMLISPLLCRICLDPYNEPTISTGCWHVHCRECWLRCLGSTKLCPICKRITGAADLRRIFI